MINNVVLMGRITAPLELKITPSGTDVLQFTVAVDRDYAKQGEERQADFISCVAWRQTADFISRYFDKGRMIALTGRLQSRTYDDKNGSKHYVTELIVDKASFTGEAKQQSQPAHTNQEDSSGSPDEYEDVLSDEGVPF
jgi:single-strand DNA-binding protein